MPMQPGIVKKFVKGCMLGYHTVLRNSTTGGIRLSCQIMESAVGLVINFVWSSVWRG